MMPAYNGVSTNAVFKLKNTVWAFPYLAVMGLIWGYLAGAFPGAIAGLAAAAAISVILGSTTSIFTATPGNGAANIRCAPAGSNMDLSRHRSTDLNVVRYHQLCHRFDDALIKVEEVLAKDPHFVEGLFLKAQILREGFEDGKAARKCLQKILTIEPDEKTVFHRWALSLYQELSEEK
jgi:hypothetical protein